MGISEDKWVESWELQQNLEIRKREERLSFMFDVVGHCAGVKAHVLDLACGPGSLGGRFTRRYKAATSVGIDYDPVLLHLARNYGGYDHTRMEFVEADLGSAGWLEMPFAHSFDAVMSTTALHWLNEATLRRVYGEIYNMLGEKGIFLNGDHLYPTGEHADVRTIFTEIRHEYQSFQKSLGKGMTWPQWWEALGKEEEFKRLLEERKRRYPEADHHDHPVSLEKHMQFLKEAGFRAVSVGWQDLDNRVIVALK